MTITDRVRRFGLFLVLVLLGVVLRALTLLPEDSEVPRTVVD